MQLRGSAGFSSLPYDWHDFVPANLWDEASGIQFELAEELMLPEEADRVFPDMPTLLCMRGKTRPTLFAAEAQTVIVDPKEFIPGMLEEANSTIQWVEANRGMDESGNLQRIHSIREDFRDCAPYL